MNDICPASPGRRLAKSWYGVQEKSCLGSSVASLALSTPITAVSAMSGWVSRIPSSSAGGTETRERGFSRNVNQGLICDEGLTLEALVLDKFFTSVNNVVESIGIPGPNITSFEPAIRGDGIFGRR